MWAGLILNTETRDLNSPRRPPGTREDDKYGANTSAHDLFGCELNSRLMASMVSSSLSCWSVPHLL